MYKNKVSKWHNRSRSWSTSEDHTIISEVLLSQSKKEELNAKLYEQEQRKSRGVYTEIDVKGQECIFLRWVIKSKLIDNKPGTKAQFCAWGFEEEQNFCTDSPTCSREDIPAMFCFIASRKWQIHSIDVKSTYFVSLFRSNSFSLNELERNKLTKYGNCPSTYMG